MRSSIRFFAVLAFTAVACGGEQPEAESPTKVTTTKVPVVESAPVPTTSATAPVEPPAPKLSMVEMQKKAINGMLAAFNAHDAKKLASFYASDAVVRTPSAGGWKEETGREPLETSHAGLFTQVPDAKMGTVRVLLKADVAVWEWVSTGTDSVGMKGEKPTNAKVGFKAASVLWFDGDGNVKFDHTYFDSGTIAGQLGKLPKGAKVRPVETLPTGDGTWIEAKNTDAETKNVDTLKSLYASMEKGDEKAFVALMDDKGGHTQLSMPTSSLGPGAVKQEFATMRKTFPDVKFNSDQSWGIGEFAVSETSMTATHKAAIGPIAATNKKVLTHVLDVAQVSGGKILGATTYDNGAELMTQISPPKKEAPKKDAPPPKK